MISDLPSCKISKIYLLHQASFYIIIIQWSKPRNKFGTILAKDTFQISPVFPLVLQVLVWDQIQDPMLHLAGMSPPIYGTSSLFHDLGTFEEDWLIIY